MKFHMDVLTSVIISSFNTPRDYIRASVLSILDQTYKNIELIIVDDCSDKITVESCLSDINDPRIKMIENEINLGLAASLNKAIEASKGKYIIRMDSDDVSMQSRIERQIEYMENNPSCDIMSGRTCLFDEQHMWVGSCFYGDAEHTSVELFFDSTLLHPSVIIRRAFIEKNNLMYNPKCRKAQDYYLWVSSFLKGADIRSVSEYYVFYRQHSGAASFKDRSKQLSVVSELHDMLLERIGLNPNPDEKKVHEIFCNPYDFNLYEWKSELKWAKKIIAANKATPLYSNKAFTDGVTKRYLSGLDINRAAKQLSKRRFVIAVLALCGKPSMFFSLLRLLVNKYIQKKSANVAYEYYIKREWEYVDEKYGLLD